MQEKVILFGAGSDMPRILPMLKKHNYIPVCICDNNRNKWGEMIEGILITSPEKIKESDVKTIIITASFFDSIYTGIQNLLGERIREYNILVAPFMWLMLVNVEYNQELLKKSQDLVIKYKSSILNYYDQKDTFTKRILNFIIREREKNEFSFLNYNDCKGMQFIEGYFYNRELDEIDNMTVLDIGAYIGDTIDELFRRYGNKICKYYAFEPQKDNFTMLKDNVETKDYSGKISLLDKALGKEEDWLFFGKKKSAYGIVEDEVSDLCEKVHVESLDSLFLDIDGKMVIKMDVEGLELDILYGAKKYIQKYTPYMAVCIYHRIEDIYLIPRFILSINSNYRFVLRSGVHTHLLAIPKD